MNKFIATIQQVDLIVSSLAKATIRCWPVILGITVPVVLLSGTGQGLELLVEDELRVGISVSLIMAVFFISGILYLTCLSRLAQWRPERTDRPTLFARTFTPALVILFFISILPVFILDVSSFSGDVKTILRNAEITCFAITFFMVTMGESGRSVIAIDWITASYLNRIRYKMRRKLEGSKTFYLFLSIAVWNIKPKLSIRLRPILYICAMVIYLARQTKKHSFSNIFLPPSARLRQLFIDLTKLSGVLVQFSIIILLWPFLSHANIFLLPTVSIIVVALFDWCMLVLIGGDIVEKKNIGRINKNLVLGCIILIAMVLWPLPSPSHSWVFEMGPIWTLVFSIAFWFSIFALISFGLSLNMVLKRCVLVCTLVALSMVLSGPFAVSKLRLLPPAKAVRSITFDGFTSEWLQAREAEILASDKPYPIIFVAAEGGGIRAAYWSSMVLALLHDSSHAFTDHTFALSGVSGGAIGVGIFSAIVDWERRGGMTSKDWDDKSAFTATALTLGGDLLSSALGATLMYDPIRSALQSNMLPERWRVVNYSDRSEIFESSLEYRYFVTTGENELSNRWQRMWSGSYHRSMPPLVISNISKTISNTRVVLTPFSVPTSWSDGAADAASLVAIDRLAYSTAIYLSARFPVISTIAIVDSDSNSVGLTDGGFSDNSGTATIKDVVDKVMTEARKKGLEKKVVPCVIEIRNGNAEELVNSKKQNIIGFSSLIETLMADRLIKQEAYRRDLKDDLKRWGGAVIDEFSLPYLGEQFPLGWDLSDRSQMRMWNRLDMVMPIGKRAIRSRCLKHV